VICNDTRLAAVPWQSCTCGATSRHSTSKYCWRRCDMPAKRLL